MVKAAPLVAVAEGWTETASIDAAPAPTVTVVETAGVNAPSVNVRV